MKSLIQAVALAAVLTVPAVSFAQAGMDMNGQTSAQTNTQTSAQTNGPLTRAQVRAELIQLEQAGYDPAAAGDAHYPSDIQEAEARVAAQNHEASAYGSVVNGASASGAAQAPARTGANVGAGMGSNSNERSIYFGS